MFCADEKNYINFFYASDLRLMSFERLQAREICQDLLGSSEFFNHGTKVSRELFQSSFGILQDP